MSVRSYFGEFDENHFRNAVEEATSLKHNPGYNPKHPYINKTNWCWSSYVQHKLFVQRYGPDHERTLTSKIQYKHLCPNEWVEEWDEQVANGEFPGSDIWGQ